jgi:ubiquinone biosynthesis protein
MVLTARHLHRYREIVEVLVRHGFSAMVTQLNLDRRLDLPHRLFRREPPAEISPAEHLRLALEELGPTFVKLGQMLSTRPDLIPPAYIAELSHLQDDVPAVPWEVIKPHLEAELGQPIDCFFGSFEPSPLAAASLGQVHAATLPDGVEVVVKVQRPHIETTIELDLDLLQDLAQLAQEHTALGEIYDLVEVAEDFAATLRAELDYLREGRNADRFRTSFVDEPNLHIPHIYWDYTTRRVLVMERIEGIKIDDVAALEAAGYDRRRIALTCARMIVKEMLVDGFFHADAHPGNFAVMAGEVVGAMDFGKVGYLDQRNRSDLVRLYIAAVQLEVADLVEQLIRMGVVGYRLDRRALERGLGRLLQKYQGLPLQEIRLGPMIEEIMTIAFRHHLHFPSNLWLLGQTLAMMEGIGLKLDPDFDIFAVSEPYVRRLQRQLWLPSEWAPQFMRSTIALADLLSRLPQQAAHLLEQTERGKLGVQVHTPDLSPAMGRLDRMVNRLAMSILVAAFIIALARLIPTLDLSWPWGWFTWFVATTFALVNLLGLWLLWKIWRSD